MGGSIEQSLGVWEGAGVVGDFLLLIGEWAVINNILILECIDC